MSNPQARKLHEDWIKTDPEALKLYQQWLAQQKSATPATPTPAGTVPATTPPTTTVPKAMESNQSISPTMLAVFDGDEEEALDFMESLNSKERRIIQKNIDNPKVIKRLKLRVRNDVEETAKDLAIDD